MLRANKKGVKPPLIGDIARSRYFHHHQLPRIQVAWTWDKRLAQSVLISWITHGRILTFCTIQEARTSYHVLLVRIQLCQFTGVKSKHATLEWLWRAGITKVIWLWPSYFNLLLPLKFVLYLRRRKTGRSSWLGYKFFDFSPRKERIT